jgi:kynurenine formamidase
MNNLVELRKQRVYLIALPLAITTLDASPVRAVAIEPED